MRFARLALVIVAAGAAIAIPAYAVTDLGAKGKKPDTPIYLLGGGIGGTSYQIGSSGGSSSLPWPGSGSSMFPNPSSVPELSTWMMLVMGFFAVGTIRYRAVRRSRVAPDNKPE